MSPCRPKEKLAEIQGAAADVTSDQVTVHSFKVRRRKDASRRQSIRTGANYACLAAHRKSSMTPILVVLVRRKYNSLSRKRKHYLGYPFWHTTNTNAQ